MSKFSTLIRCAGIACAVALSVGAANAHSILLYSTGSTSIGGGDWQTVFDVGVSGANEVTPPNATNPFNLYDGFTLRDITGLESVSSLSGFTYVPYSGTDVQGYYDTQSPLFNNPLTPDVTFHFTYGSNIGSPTTAVGIGSFTLITDSAITLGKQNTDYAFQDHILGSGQLEYGSGSVMGGTFPTHFMFPVPEPPFCQMGALLALGGLFYFRRRRTVTSRSFSFAAA